MLLNSYIYHNQQHCNTKQRLKIAMSDDNQQEDERKLYRCVRKYKTIVKQFDELIEMMSSRTKPPKRRRVTSVSFLNKSSSGGSNNTTTPTASSQSDNNEVFVQTILRFLQELRVDSTTDPDPDSSSTQNQK